MGRSTILFVVLMNAFMIYAADTSENGVPVTPLTTYSGGLGIGGNVAMNDELRDQSKNFLNVSFINTVYYKKHLDFFFDATWYAPGLNFGADIGIDLLLSETDFKPFFGVGIGAAYFNKSDNFGDNVGPSGTVHFGFLFDINDAVQVRFRIPYRYVANENRDNMAGIEVGFLFSDRYKKVNKLNYNR